MARSINDKIKKHIVDIKEKVVIITGASSGIGEASAKKLAKEGAKVVLTAKREERLSEIKDAILNLEGSAIGVSGDVTKEDDFSKVASKTLEEFGTIDVIINNAGLMPLSYVKKLKTSEQFFVTFIQTKASNI